MVSSQVLSLKAQIHVIGLTPYTTMADATVFFRAAATDG